jgi:hypothetical protein
VVRGSTPHSRGGYCGAAEQSLQGCWVANELMWGRSMKITRGSLGEERRMSVKDHSLANIDCKEILSDQTWESLKPEGKLGGRQEGLVSR